MRVNLRRALTVIVAAAALIPGVAPIASAPASAETICPAGSNWDSRTNSCR